MEFWMTLPWWVRMVVSVSIIAVGVWLFFWAVLRSGGRGLLGIAGLVVMVGLAGFATSFPSDNSKYKF